MKYLKYFLILVAVLAIVFVGMGFLQPSVVYEREVIVDKSANEAWAVMSDESKLSEWIKGYKRMELVSGTPNTVGAVSNIYVEENGQEMMMEETVTAIVPNELLAMTFTAGFMTMDYEMHLEEKEGKTHIRTVSEVVGNGVIARSIVAFMPKSMKAQEEENLNNLKRVINENTTDYFPEAVLDSSEEVVEEEE